MTAMGTDNVIPCAIAADPGRPSDDDAGPVLASTTSTRSATHADLTAPVDAALPSRGVLAEQFTPGMPAFVTVSKLKIDVATTIDGEPVT